MFSTDDTIVAIATPPGRGGIGVVRISGPAASREVADALLQPRRAAAPRHATFARHRSGDRRSRRDLLSRPALLHRRARRRDQRARQPGRAASDRRAAAMAAGARLAEPGEFTLRAFLNGKRSIWCRRKRSRDLIDAVTPLQARVGVRSARRHADRAHRGDRRRAVRSDREARGVARFSRRGIPLRRAGRDGQAIAGDRARRSTRCCDGARAAG